MSDAEREPEHGEHQITPLELFFDLTFVFAMTQVTVMLADDPTWGGVFRGMLVLAALWWAWSVYAWLTSAMDVDEGRRPACDASLDGSDVRRRPGGAGRLRR